MAKYRYKEEITTGTPGDDANFSIPDDNVRNERRLTEDSFTVDRFRRGNGNTSKPLSKHSRRKKEGIFKHSSIDLIPSDLSIDSYMPTTDKTKQKVTRRDERNASTNRSTNQWKLGSQNMTSKRSYNRRRHSNTSSDYLFVVPISEIGCCDANVEVIKRLKHIKKFNYQQHSEHLDEISIKIPPSLTPEEGSKNKVNFRDPRKMERTKKVRPETSFGNDQIFKKQKCFNTMNTEQTSLDDKEKWDMDSFNNLKKNLVEFVSNTFLYTERRRNEQNQKNSVKDSIMAVPLRGTSMVSDKIIYQSRENRKKSSDGYKTHNYSFGQEAFSDKKNSKNVEGGYMLPNSLKESFTKQRGAFVKQSFKNYPKNYYDSESDNSILTNRKTMKSKSNKLKKSGKTNHSKKSTKTDDFKQDCDDLESDVVILNASDSQFFKITDFLKIKNSKSNSKRELKGKVYYETEKLNEDNSVPRVHIVEGSERLKKKVTSDKLKPVRFPLDSFRDVLVFRGKIEASTIKRLSKQLDNNYSSVSNQTAITKEIISDKNCYQEFNPSTITHLSKQLENNSDVTNPTKGIISDKNCYQEFNPSTITHLSKQLENNSCVSNSNSGITKDRHFYKELKHNSNIEGSIKELNHQPSFPLQHNSFEHDMIPELDRPPSQHLKRKLSCNEKYDTGLSNNAMTHGRDLKIKHSKKTTKPSQETLKTKQSEHLGMDLLTQASLQEQSSDTLKKCFPKADEDVSDKKVSSDHCTLNEIEINNTKYSGFEINLKDSPLAKTKVSKTTVFANFFDKQPSTKSHKKENSRYKDLPNNKALIKNNQRSNDSKVSVSIAIQTDLHLIDELEKENEYMTNTKGTLTNDLDEHIYINKAARSQIEKARSKFVQSGELSLLEVISNNKQTRSEPTFKKTSNSSIPTESDIFVPKPIISEPDDFFDDVISLKNKSICFGGRINEPKYASEMHNDRKFNVQSSEYHSKSSYRVHRLIHDTEKLNNKPLQGSIDNKLENDISYGFNSQIQISTQEISDVRKVKYSKREFKSTRCSEWPFSKNERQTTQDVNNTSYGNLIDLKKSQMIARFIEENMNSETNNIKNVISSPKSETVSKKHHQCSNLNNEGIEFPVAVQEGRMGEHNDEMKTKLSEQQSLMEIGKNVLNESNIRKLSDPGLLSWGINNKLNNGNLLPKNTSRNDEGINVPRSLHQMNSIAGTDENNEESKTPLAIHSFIATHQNTSYQSGTLIGENINRNNEGTKFLTSPHSADIIDKNHEHTTMPPLALQSLMEINRNPTHKTTRKSNSAGLLSSDRNNNLDKSMLSLKSPDRHNGGIKFYRALHSTEIRDENNEEIKMPNLSDKEKKLSTSILLEKNTEQDITKLNALEELPKKYSQSSYLDGYIKNKQTAQIPITKSKTKPTLLEPSDVERAKPSEIDNCKLIKLKSQHEKTDENGDNSELTKKQSVHHICEKVPFKYEDKSTSDANISLKQSDLKSTRSSLSSFDHILLNISIRDKETKHMPGNKNHPHVPFKKSLILMPINKTEREDYKMHKNNDLETPEKFNSDPHCFAEVCMITPTNKEIQCALDDQTSSLCSQFNSKTSSEIAIEENIATENSNKALSSSRSALEGHAMELGQINAEVKPIQATSHNSSEINLRTSNNANSSDKTSQSDKLEKLEKATKKNSKRKVNRLFLCNYITYIPFNNIMRKLGGINILTVDKGQQFQLYTRFVKSDTTNNTIDDPLASVNYSLNQLKNLCFRQQNILI